MKISSHISSSYKIWVPNDGVPLTVRNVGIVCEQDGVVGHHWITSRQNASCRVAYTVQDAIIHKKVVHQQLYTQKHTDFAVTYQCKTPEYQAHSRQSRLPQTPSLLFVVSLSSSTA